MNSTKTHYGTLGVSHSAEDVVIRAAYRALSQRYHPDLNAGDVVAEAKMVEINAAYAILSDSKSRAAYDAVLANLGRPATAPDDVQSRVKPVSARPPAGPASTISATRKKWFPKVFAAVILAAVGLLVLREFTLPRKEPVRVLAERGDIPSQMAMGWNSLLSLNGQKEDIDQAIEWFQKAALQGNADAQYRLGDIYITSSSERHDDKLRKAW